MGILQMGFMSVRMNLFGLFVIEVVLIVSKCVEVVVYVSKYQIGKSALNFLKQYLFELGCERFVGLSQL